MVIWGKSLKLVKKVYRLTDSFPRDEKFGLSSQLRRAAVSIISNISEGEARISQKEKRRFYEIACASLVEVDAQIEIAIELEFISELEIQELASLVNECFAMLSKLKKHR